MDLDLLIHSIQPLLRPLHCLRRRRFHFGIQIGARGHVDDELARQFGINWIQSKGIRPCRRKVGNLRLRLWRRRLRGRHDFTIQLGTAATKRAATMVFPGWYCTATTEASVSSEPSELRSRKMSANSSGV